LTATNREAAISKTLTYEGGYTDGKTGASRYDPGGATNWGITITDARLHWKPDATAADVKAMPKAVAIEIYRKKYWAKIGCDARPSGPDFVEFDTSVNSGVGRVTSWRRALDPLNLTPVEYVKRFCAKRSSFLHGLRTWGVFGPGWGKRVADVEATGVRMALGAAGKPLAPALNKQAREHVKKSLGHSTAAASGSAAAPSLPQHVPFHMTLGTEVALVAIGIVVIIGITYFIWNAVHHAHRAAAYTEAAK
jgi:lysozyme family protein